MENQYNIPDLISFLRNTQVKSFKDDYDIYSIIRSFLDEQNNDNAFYIVNLTTIIEQFKLWMENLPNITPYYAIKCNPNSVIIQLLDKLGANFDCASKFEMAQVLDLDIPARRIIYANPCKESQHIKYARSTDVDFLVLDSLHEIYKIKLHHPAAKLLIRSKIDDYTSMCRFRCKFGATLQETEKLCELAKASGLDVIGVSFHVGSNCLDLDTYKNAIRDARKAFDIGKKYNFNFYMLDIGGGFPGNDANKFTDIAKKINSAISEYFPEDYIDPEKLNVIAEPGRFFVSASHTLVLNVIGKKEYIQEVENKGDDFLETEKHNVYYLNDGVYKSFNCVYYDHQQPEILPYNERDGKLYKSTVFGPTCDGMDIIAENCQLPDLAIGEWVFVENFGAYTTAAASTFNGFQEIPCFYIMKY
jgi:diaminopimelate decarboxylase